MTSRISLNERFSGYYKTALFSSGKILAIRRMCKTMAPPQIAAKFGMSVGDVDHALSRIASQASVQPCLNYHLYGNCLNGSQCCNVHETNFAGWDCLEYEHTGKCPRGEACRFLHDSSTRIKQRRRYRPEQQDRRRIDFEREAASRREQHGSEDRAADVVEMATASSLESLATGAVEEVHDELQCRARLNKVVARAVWLKQQAATIQARYDELRGICA